MGVKETSATPGVCSGKKKVFAQERGEMANRHIHLRKEAQEPWPSVLLQNFISDLGGSLRKTAISKALCVAKDGALKITFDGRKLFPLGKYSWKGLESD